MSSEDIVLTAVVVNEGDQLVDSQFCIRAVALEVVVPRNRDCSLLTMRHKNANSMTSK